MFDLSADLQTFYDEDVRLGVDRRARLAGHRDLNITRLKNGLDDLAEESKRPRPHPYDWKNQGGYAMHTLNQDPRDDNDYDIDVALLFERAALPEDPRNARQRIADALCKRCTNFTQEPTARTNAVTVWYAEGYHIDFAIFRTYTDEYGREKIEHASTDWKARNPLDVNNWFLNAVNTKSPAIGMLTTVKPGQLRRIVRFLKWFTRSRPSWSLPGGLIVSTLVVECYRPDFQRDDLALYNTIVALRNRLAGYTRVDNPVDGSEFTANPEILNQIKRFKTQLDMAVGKLAPLFVADCDRAKARGAWDWVFVHDFWGGKEVAKVALDETLAASVPSAYFVKIQCDLARSERAPTYKQYASGSSVLPKNLSLRFTVASTNVPAPYKIVWHVDNHGDEASDADQLTWETQPSESYEHWTSTAYKGSHRMICRIMKDGRVWAETSHIVKIAPGKWWKR
jgi:Adenylyl/Guanylyl and SMODS C-terminal sensor domain